MWSRDVMLLCFRPCGKHVAHQNKPSMQYSRGQHGEVGVEGEGRMLMSRYNKVELRFGHHSGFLRQRREFCCHCWCHKTSQDFTIKGKDLRTQPDLFAVSVVKVGCLPSAYICEYDTHVFTRCMLVDGNPLGGGPGTRCMSACVAGPA